MNTTPPRLGPRMRDLGLALLNATLLLAVLLVFGIWLLLGRIQDFAADTVGAIADNVGADMRQRIATQANTTAATVERVRDLDTRLLAALDRIEAPPAPGSDPQTEPGTASADPASTFSTEGFTEGVTPAPSADATAVALRDLRTEVTSLTQALDDTRAGLAALRDDLSGKLRLAMRQLLLDIAAQLGPAAPQNPQTGD
ncbi:MAG: hypothetical protein AAF672_15500 [Pseudomonadota bacterium]